MGKKFFPISKIDSSKCSWNIRAKVIRLCEVMDFNKPTQVFSIEMVLMDVKGERIHATVPNSLLLEFKSRIAEGKTYAFEKLSVRKKSSKFRTTNHPFRLRFEYESKVVLIENSNIIGSPYVLIPISSLVGGSHDTDILVDVVGVLTGVGMERELEIHGIMSKSKVIQLEAGGHKIQCSLFGNYVDHLNSFIKYGELKNAIVTIQFAKTTSYEGIIYLHSCLDFTRIIFNPLSSYGISTGTRIHPVLLTHLAFDHRVETSNDFLYNTTRSTMKGLNDALPGKLIVVIGTIKRIINPANFGYTSCVCSKGIEPESQMFACDQCHRNHSNLFPRYFLRIQAIDDTGCVTLVLLDSPARTLFNKTCSEMLQHNEHAVALGQVPLDIYRLVNQTVLFKVEKNELFGDANQTTFIVRKICMDSYAINEFQKAKQSSFFGKDLTPEFLGSACVAIQMGAELNDGGSSSNRDCHDEKEAEDINILLSLFKTSMQF